MSENVNKSVVIVGGGLVGPLFALFLARRGYKVSLYEKRKDPRTSGGVSGRSINLALSNRGRRALEKVQLEDEILKFGVPMKGRLIHPSRGEQKAIPYDRINNQCIYSVSRNLLNQKLLNALEDNSNVSLYFAHKLIGFDVVKNSLKFLDLTTNETVVVVADLVVGADGAFSRLRQSVQNLPLFDYNQTYINHGYIEMCIPPKSGNLMTANHLHIWPRGEFMMIALPNVDSSWTVTLFMPFENFQLLDSPDKIVGFFRDVFPDSIDLIGKSELVEFLYQKRPSSLVSIKCGKFNIDRNALLIGDAAHGMVPFYGQGMNCGFEDCLIFDSILNECGDLGDALEMFSEVRIKDAHAICDLAMYNYVEMRDLVTRPSYLIRKFLDDLLSWLFPNFWIPLYNSVTFSKMSYQECVDNRKWQNYMIFTFCICVLLCIAIVETI